MRERHSAQEWADRVNCILQFDWMRSDSYGRGYWELNVYDNYKDKRKCRNSLSDVYPLVNIDAECSEDAVFMPSYHAESVPWLTVKKYSVGNWVEWLEEPVTAELESDKHVHYYVHPGQYQVDITPFISNE